MDKCRGVRLDIHTGADLRQQSLAFLQAQFGKAGPWYHAIARGIDDRPVVPDRPRKSSGSETTFATDLTDLAEIETGVVSMADEVWAWCETANVFGRTVTVKIKYADFRQATRSRTQVAPVSDRATLRQVSIDLVRSVFPPAQGIRLLGVTLSSFDGGERTGTHQLDLGLAVGSQPSKRRDNGAFPPTRHSQQRRHHRRKTTESGRKPDRPLLGEEPKNQH